ncbi:MAG TPA: SpaA isopeptide-forming pilin-related protein, partial [Erysipelothrix sp.]
GKVKFEKISGETNEALAGIEFNLYHNDQLIKEKLTTDSAGMIQLDLLSPGAYTFIETKSDENHLISKEKVAFEIADENENDYPVVDAGTLENHYAEVKFKNTNPNRDEIYKDAQFKLETFINNEWVTVENYENFGLNEDLDDKYFTLVGLGKGNYRLTQVQAPEKTILNEAVYDFTITDEHDETINKRPLIVLDDYINYKGSVMVDVIDPYGKVQLDISAHYSLVNETDKTDMTLVNGQLQAENLSPGKYRIYVDSVDGAILVDETIDFEIVAQALNDEKTVSQNTLRVTYAYQDISLLDGKDETPLETGVWQLSQKDWQKDYQIDQKTITVKDLKPGTYNLIQSQAAHNYILNSLNKVSFTVEKNLTDYDEFTYNEAGYPIVKLEPLVFSNYKQKVIVEKTDDNNNALANVGFSLNDRETNYTDQEGHIIYDQLAPGHYTLVESSPLKGYQALKVNPTFEIASVQAGEPAPMIVKIINNKEVIQEEKPNEVITPEGPQDLDQPIIPALGMSNQSLYAALILLAAGVIIYIMSKRNK